MKTKNLLVVVTLVVSTFTLSAQSSFDKVYSILQTNCASNCHKTGQPDGGLLLDGSKSDVYNNIVGALPTNVTALAADNKLIDPGYPYRSFLMRKMGHDLDSSLAITAMEGSYMPVGSSVSDLDVELVRQWILWGAADTGVLFDAQVVEDYFTLSGNQPSIARPASPVEEGKTGYQVRIGPFYLNAGEEVEYFKKEELDFYFDGAKDIIGLSAEMNLQSHHFALFDLNPSQPYKTSYVPVESAADQLIIHLAATEVGAWNESLNIPMPTGAAYKWPENTHIVLDYHILNSTASILPADAWLNIYTEEPDVANEEMSLIFPNFGDLDPWGLAIPPTGPSDYFTETMVVNAPGSNEIWKVWRLQGHTHSIGTDFNAWLRNADGTKGDLIYEGTYNFDYSTNQGYYDYAHAPIRKWEPYMEVDAENGFIFEATYQNTTNDTIKFGLTTEDEMFAGYIHYIAVPKTSGINSASDYSNLEVYPNPVTDLAEIILPEDAINNPYTLTVYDLSGRVVLQQTEIRQTKVLVDMSAVENGVYLVELNGSKLFRTKLMVH